VRRGDKTVVLFSFFPKLMMLELELAPVIGTKSNRLPWCQRASPSTTRYESVKSTDADRLMQVAEMSKTFFKGGLPVSEIPFDGIVVQA
jgi:hypothetical protein